jgi:hypothetical protein
MFLDTSFVPLLGPAGEVHGITHRKARRYTHMLQKRVNATT